MDMKYIVFMGGLFVLVPVGIFVTSYSRRMREIVFVSLIVCTSFIDRIDINFLDRWWYRGTTRGIEISFVDFFVLMLICSTVASTYRERSRLYWPASLGLMLLFLAYCSFGVAISEARLFGMFELSKMLRGLLAFLAVAFYVRSERDLYVFILAFSAVLVCQGCLALMQRYFMGMMRVRGSFIHPSALSNYCCLLAPLLLSVSLGRIRPIIQWFCALAWALACVATILSITRMAIVAFMIASGGVLCSALGTHLNTRKMALVLVCGVVGAGLVIRGYDKMVARHIAMTAAEEAGDASAGRKVYYLEALDMPRGKPLGVGLNNWSWWLSAEKGHPYDSTEERGYGQREVMAHSAFALTMGELGWPGFFIFLALWLQWLLLSGRFLFVRTLDLTSSSLRGCFFAIVAAFLSALTEHNFRGQLFFIVFNIMLGFMVSVRRIRVQSTD